MPDALEALKFAELKLFTLIKAIPNFDLIMDYQFQTSFPHRPANSCVDLIYITYALPAEPGQAPELVSYSLADLIETSYQSGHVPTYEQGTTQVYEVSYSQNPDDLAPGIDIVQVEAFVRYVISNLDLVTTNAITHFWKTPRADLDDKNPKDWLYAFCCELLRNENALRHEDKTLSDSAHAAVIQILEDPAYPARVQSGVSKPLSVYRAALKGELNPLDIALQGVLIITDKNAANLGYALDTFSIPTAPPLSRETDVLTAHKAVLYIPSTGLEEFDSLYALSQELEARFKDPYQRQTLLDCIELKDRERAKGLSQLGYREVIDDAPISIVHDLINTLDQNISHAWATVRSSRTQYNFEALTKEIEKALRLNLSPAGIVRARYTRLLESQLPTWLKSASDEHKQQWRQAVERLSQERLASQTLENNELIENGHISSLLSYARAQLKKQIKADHQLDVDPAQIFIVTTEAFNTSPGVYPLSTSGYAAGVSASRTGPTITYVTTKRSLSELALQNVGKLDITYALTAGIQDAQGNHHPVLTGAYIKELVRTLDIGSSYMGLIYDTLINPDLPKVKWRKERYSALNTAQLRLDILETRLANRLNAEEISWVEHLLAHPAKHGRPSINGKHISSHLLMLYGAPLPGAWVISATGTTRMIVYTPNAPDKVWLRRADTLKELYQELSKQSLRPWLLQRVTAKNQPYVLPLLKAGLTGSNVQLGYVTDHFLNVGYDEEANFAWRNADEQSTSTYEANLQTAKDVTLAILDIVSFVLPTKLLVPLALARFIYTLTEGFDALKREDNREAFFHFMGSISHLTDAASDFAGSAVFGGVMRARIKQPVLTFNPQAVSPVTPAGMRVRTGDHYDPGIYQTTQADGTSPKHYLKDTQGNLYRSQYDNLQETWRIIDERQPDAIYRAPAQALSAGRWAAGAPSPSGNTKMGLPELIERAQTRQVDLARHAPDAEGIYTLDSRHYIQQNGITFEVQNGWLGRHWYVQVPSSSHSTQTTYKVRRDESGQWKVKHRDSAGAKQWEPLMLNHSEHAAPAEAISYSAYDAVKQHAKALRDMTASQEIDFHNYAFFNRPEWEAARQHLALIQLKMFQDAQTFFRAPNPKPRAQLPTLPADATPETLFTHLYEKNAGVIIGEAHADASGKKILMDNMELLAKKGVKVLYLEHLQTDLHQAFLDTFFKTGNMAPELHAFLKSQDLGHGSHKNGSYTFDQLVRETYRHKIQIKALDCIASYHPKGLSKNTSRSPRHEVFSYGASQIIRAQEAKTPGHKWAALVGNSHTNTYEGIPGLAEIEGGIGLRVQDVAPGSSLGLRPDSGLVHSRPLTINHHSFLKNDLLLDVEIPGTRPSIPPLSSQRINEMLQTPGQFLFDTDAHYAPQLIHRSSTRDIIRTPLHTNAEGMIFIDRPSWGAFHQKRYALLRDLIRDLIDMGMTPKFK